MASPNRSNHSNGYMPAITGLICGVLVMLLAASLALLWRAGFVSGEVAAGYNASAASAAHQSGALQSDASGIEAKAAMVSANAATWQTAINVFGLVGLAFTVLYARRAWLETKNSADAAWRTLEYNERAWIVLHKVRIEWSGKRPGKPNDWMVKFLFRNVGRLPATIDICEFKLVERSSLPPKPDYSDMHSVGVPYTFGPGDEYETQAFGPSNPGPASAPIQYAVVGRICYREIGGSGRATGFAVDVSPHFPAFSATALKDYHYHT